MTDYTRNKYFSCFSLLVSIILLLNSIFYIRHNPLIEVYERKLDFVHTWCRRKENKLYNRRVIWLLLPELVTRIELENNDVQGLHFWNCYINSDEITDIYSCKAIETDYWCFTKKTIYLLRWIIPLIAKHCAYLLHPWWRKALTFETLEWFLTTDMNYFRKEAKMYESSNDHQQKHFWKDYFYIFKLQV